MSSKPFLKPITPVTPRPAAPVNRSPDPDFKGIGQAVQSYAEEQDIPRQTSSRAQASAGQGAPPTPQAHAPTPSRSKTWERFTVELPTYLYDDIRMRLSTKKQTKKSVVLHAFNDAGYYVAPEDLVEDGRRGK